MPNLSIKTIAVVGATGTQGGAVARALITYGHKVRGLTRDTSSAKAQALQSLGIDVVYADLGDPASLVAALKGVDAVFGVTTPFGTNAETEVLEGKNLIDAAVTSGVEHFVFSSATNADRQTGIPHFESKYKVEEYLRSQPINWTIIAPAAFMDDFLSGRYKKTMDEGMLARPMPSGQALPYICSEDIGAFSAFAIDKGEQFYRQRIDIGGDNITGQQIVDTISKRLGKQISYHEVPLEIAETYSHDLAAMFGYFQTTGLDVDIDKLRREYPEVHWHTFAEWAERNIQPGA